MPAEKGSAFLLKVGDGAATPVYTTLAGLRTTQLSINGDSVVITNKGSGGWRELLSGAGGAFGFGFGCGRLHRLNRRSADQGERAQRRT